jgi:hypothetical protein
MATVNQILSKTRTLTNALVNQVANRAPVRTGNLKRQIKRANNVNTVFESTRGTSKSVPIQSFSFSIDYAPEGAEYGMYWNDPTVSYQVKNQKTGNKDKINFVEQAIMTPEFQKGLDDLLDLIGETVAQNVADALDE